MATTSSGADPAMVNKIASHLKSQGIFDQFRRDCLEDVDTKPAYQNLRQKVEGYVSAFLAKVKWEPKMNKNQLRDSLRRQINQSEMLSTGVERIIEQVIEPKMQHIFRPQIVKVVDEFLGLDGNKNAESVKKDLASTSGWQGVSHQITAPAPPDLPPGVPTPAPPLPPSEPPAAPPEAPPETPPDSPPDEPEIPPASVQDSLKVLLPGTSPTASSGRNTPSSTTSKGSETPSSVKKQLGGLPQSTADPKGEKKPVSDHPNEGLNKSAGLAKALVVKSEQVKSQGGIKPPLGKDQGVKKPVPKDQFYKMQPLKVKKVAPGSKPDSIRAADKPKAVIPSKSVVSKLKTLADFKKEGQSTKPLERDADNVPFTQAAIRKTLRDSETKSPPLELDKKPMRGQLSPDNSQSKLGLVMDTEHDPQDVKQEQRSISPLSLPDAKASSQADVDTDLSMDLEIMDDENMDVASKGDDSECESGLSDISVSSVHTSDLSSFDEDISSTSSSSSIDSSSDEETEPKHVSPKKKKPTTNIYPSDSDSEVPSEVTISTDTSRPASVASDKASARRSPKAATIPTRALAISRYHGDSEDEDSRQERRRKAALAKEERARRRQLAKEEREKVIVEKRDKRALDSESANEMGESKRALRREETVTSSPLKVTKEQLKEQKILEKKREVRRRRSLNKRYFSDEFSSSMQGMKGTVSQQDDDDLASQEQVKQPEYIPLRTFILKEKPQCFHLIYRERREPQVKCNYLLTQGLSGEQQKKLSTRKRKERRDSKVSRFSFAQAKVMAGMSGEGSSKHSASSQPDKKEVVLEQQQQEQLQHLDKQQQQQQQPEDVKDEFHEEKEAETQGEQTLLPKPEYVQEPFEEQNPSEDVLPSRGEQILHSVEETENLCKEVIEEEIKMEVENTNKIVKVSEEQLQEADEPVQDLEKLEREETTSQGQDELKDSLQEKQDQDKPEEEDTQTYQHDSPIEIEKISEETQMQEVQDMEVVYDEHRNQEEVQEDAVRMETSKEQTTKLTSTQPIDELSTRTTTTIEEVITPPQAMTAEDAKPAVPVEVHLETSGDDIDNPPTPTQDEPSIYSDADSESEEQSDKGSSIPIYTVHSPKHLPLGSVFKLSQTSLQDIKPIGSGRAETRTLSKDSDASALDDTEGTEKVCAQRGDTYQGEDSHECNTDSDKQGSGAKAELSETHDKPSTSETSESSQPESRYGTRPKRHTVSPRDSLDDDYFYYGQPKRGRYSQSPISHQEEAGKAGRSRARRISTDSGKSEGTGRETADRLTRSSHQRHISPPHRYSPSDNRASHRRSTSSPNPPATPNPPIKQTRRGSSPSSHEHFTRRSSGRDEAKRGNRYSDMYYYNDRGARGQTSARGGDRGRNPEPVSSRRSSRKSVDDRAGNQASTKRRK